MSPSPANVVAADAAAIGRGARLLREGRLVSFPTETVYGLGADATSEAAVAALFAAKKRPQTNPLIAHVASAEAAAREGAFDDRARRLAGRFWPGPLTLVLRRRGDCRITARACAGLDTVALRVPDHRIALALLAEAGRPVAAPSANPSGRLSPTTAEHVAEALGDAVALILDAGPCPVGVESTVLDLSQPGIVRLLRPGGVARAAIEAEIGALAAQDEGPARSPGMRESHYAPRLPLRLEAANAGADEALLAFGPDAPQGAAAALNLSPTGDLDEAAANLFAMLHVLDRPEFSAIAVMPIPDDGLGAAINDRLRRAASPRRRAAGEDAA
ncbi:MAG: L-threonylcarbamoyladenylate synthase [Alphaproteobacteria bacterium]